MNARRALLTAAGAMILTLAPWLDFAGAADSALDSLMSLFAQRRHAEADFTEEKYLSVLKQPLKASGKLVYDAPDHLEERTLTPRPQDLVLDRGILSMRIGTHSHTLRLADYPQLAPLIDSIRATLAGDRMALEHAFNVDFSGNLERWQLHLSPRDPQINDTLSNIEIQGERDAVHEVRVQQRDGDRSVMHITPLE
jgi:hypothetical protein